MKKRIPKGVKTIFVNEYFNIRKDFSNNLRLRKRENGYWQAEYLPEKEDDIRPNEGRSKSGKRLTIRKSMETKDPDIAAKQAVEWNIEKRRSDLLSKKEVVGFGNNLEYYWNFYYQKECSEKERTHRTYKKWQRDELLKWTSDSYGISTQEWSKIGVDKINDSHIEEYSDSLSTGMKAQQKTVLNKLFKIAKKDLVGHVFPSFPEIKKSESNQPVHLRKEDWEKLLDGINNLSEGSAKENLSIAEYVKLPFNPNNLDNVSNWVDLHDALLLEWFFYLRAEDMPRVRVEWFEMIKENDDVNVICNLEETKGDRSKHETTHYRPDAVRYWERLSKRRQKRGWLICPNIERSEEGGGEYSVLKRLNSSLKRAIDHLLPAYSDKNISWTNIRHTAFRLTLEEYPELGQVPAINDFALNGRTSPDMLYKTYLRYFEGRKTAKVARTKLKPSEYTLVRKSD